MKNKQLLEEIRSLGGTESDIELLEGLSDVDEDLEKDNNTKNASLKSKQQKKTKKMKNSTSSADNEKDLTLVLEKMIKSSEIDIPKISIANHNDVQKQSHKEEDEDEPRLIDETTMEEEEDDYYKSTEKVQGGDEDFADNEPEETQLDPKSQAKFDDILGKIENKLYEKKNSKSKQNESNRKLNRKLLVPVGSQWYAEYLKPIDQVESGNESLLVPMYQKAKQLYEEEAEKYASESKSSTGSKDFIATVLKSGTVTDKVSAITLLIQESPFHTLNFFQKNLLDNMARKKARREALMALDSIKDLMITNLLPNKKLRYFRDQPWAATNVSNKHLVLWYYEDTLKKLYFEYIKILEEFIMDPLTNIKNKALYYIHDCFMNKPEQEHNLLTLLVNKLGDNDKKITSKTSHLLLKTLTTHPNMKFIVAKEVEQLMFRANVGKKTQYYCVNVLNQIVLTKSELDTITANHLINVYFTLFENLVRDSKQPATVPADAPANKNNTKNQKNTNSKNNKYNTKKSNGSTSSKTSIPVVNPDVDAKMMAAILTGVNRSFPFSNINDETFDSKIDILFRIAHMGNINTSIQALSLIFQVQFSKQAVSDRYYRVLYESLLDQRLVHTSKQSMYLNLLYRSLKNDVSAERVKAFIKRLIQICVRVSSPFACASLFMVSELGKCIPSIWGLILQPEDQEDEVFKDEVDDDDEEKFVDVKEDIDDNKEEVEEKNTKEKETKFNMTEISQRIYDGRKRDPLYANAGASCLWELVSFANHFHPTLSLYACTLLSGQSIQPPAQSVNYDPLQNHTIQRFLDRFVYKNPKKVDNAYKGSSLMQPRGVVGKTDDMIVAGGQKKRQVIVKDDATGEVEHLDDKMIKAKHYIGKKIQDVPADEMFFHYYFNGKAAEIMKKNEEAKEKEFDDDDFSDHQSIDEDEVWEAITKSNDLPKELNVVEDGSDDELENLKYSDDDLEDDLGEGGEFVELENLDDDQEDMDELDKSDESDGNLQNDIEDDDIIVSDNEMAELFQDDEDDFEQEDEDEKPKPGVKGRKAIDRMSEKAKALGYKGGYFNKEAASSAFASADDFAALISNNASDNEDKPGITTKSDVSKKRKSGMKTSFSEKKQKSN